MSRPARPALRRHRALWTITSLRAFATVAATVRTRTTVITVATVATATIFAWSAPLRTFRMFPAEPALGPLPAIVIRPLRAFALRRFRLVGAVLSLEVDRWPRESQHHD